MEEPLDFRDLIDMSDEFIMEDDLENKARNLVDGKGFVLFFSKGKDIFGCGEDGRITFAKLKHPDEDTPEGWEEDASFTALNLKKEIIGEPSEHVITKEDVKKIKVLDRSEILEKVKNEAKKLGDKAFPKKNNFSILDLSKFFHKDPDDAPNFMQAQED